jgi:hypothetical protein
MAEVTEQIVREAPDIEAYKIGLLQSAKALADQGITIPPQMVAEMSGLQVKATELAEAGIGGYQPYLQEAGYTLGDAQTALGGVMAGAMPFQGEAADLMRTGAANVPGQITAAQQGISGALDYGAQGVQTATGGLGTAAENARLIAAQSAADQLAAYDAIPGGIGAAQQGMAGAAATAAGVADAARMGGAGVGQTLGQELGAATQGARTYGAMGAGALQAQQLAQENLLQASDQARLQALAGQQGLAGAIPGLGESLAGYDWRRTNRCFGAGAAQAAQAAGLGTQGAIDALAHSKRRWEPRGPWSGFCRNCRSWRYSQQAGTTQHSSGTSSCRCRNNSWTSASALGRYRRYRFGRNSRRM